METVHPASSQIEAKSLSSYGPVKSHYSSIKNFRYLVVRLISCPIPFIRNDIPIIGGKSFIETAALFLIIIITVIVCFGKKKDAQSLGHIADGLFAATVVLGLRNNVLTFLFGISFERALSYHKWFAIAACVATIFHGISFGPNDTGFILVALFGGMSSLYLLKPYFFNLFYFSHVLFFVVAIIIGLTHGAIFYPILSIVWVIDVVLRYFITQHSENADIKLIPGSIIKIEFEKSFQYEAGQYCFIMIPLINRYEYHPFSISSSPYESKTSFHIRALGDWTKKLQDMVEGENGLKKVDVKIEGPFGRCAINFNDENYEVFYFYFLILILLNVMYTHIIYCRFVYFFMVANF
jgi:predicted ferric reductase